ncbi:MAG: hypothetical protein ACR5K5_05890 [Wolbachia sp.]
MEYEQFSKIYNALKSASADSSLNQDNVIKAVKDKLLSGSDGYKEWEKGNFGLDHVFTTENSFGVSSKHALLIRACQSEDLKVADFLLKAGASVNVAAGNENPFTVAIENEWEGSKEDAKAIVDLLIGKVDAHVSAADENVNNTIVKAVERGNLRVFKALKEAGANVNIQAQGMSLLKWAELHQPDRMIKKEDMEEIINTLKDYLEEEEKEQTGPEIAASTSTGGQPLENNGTNFWSEHKWKIALSVVGLCTAGAIAAYVLAYPAVALALAVLAAVILMGAGIAKVLEDPSVEGLSTSKEQRA